MKNDESCSKLTSETFPLCSSIPQHGVEDEQKVQDGHEVQVKVETLYRKSDYVHNRILISVQLNNM